MQINTEQLLDHAFGSTLNTLFMLAYENMNDTGLSSGLDHFVYLWMGTSSGKKKKEKHMTSTKITKIRIK